MSMKNIVWDQIKKVITHDSFKEIFQEQFPTIINPSQQRDLIDNSAVDVSSLYPDLQHPKKQHKVTPVFITARFRSGSTLLWNIFRQINHVHSYYEPLNERMWFDKTQRQGHTDDSHIGVKDYWAEYDHIKDVAHLFSKKWTSNTLLMDQSSLNTNMRKYIEALISQSPKRPVLQFNRVDFRIQWLKSNFSQAKIIHLYRHPRDLWISVSRKSAPVNLALNGHDYSDYNLFYTMEWARDLSSAFPFLDPSLRKHPYYYHYLLWRLSYIYGATFSDISISYEGLVSDTENTLNKVFDCINLQVEDTHLLKNCISQQKSKQWHTYADDSWYQTIELECNDILTSYFSKQTPIT